MDENRIPKRVLHMNLETTRLRGRPRNRWQEVREDGRIVGGEEWQEKTGMEEAPDNSKELLHSAHVSGMNEWFHTFWAVLRLLVHSTYMHQSAA
jgi:hypothetical protein